MRSNIKHTSHPLLTALLAGALALLTVEAASAQADPGNPAGPPGASPQTMPSTLSERNAALDRLPIIAQPLALTDAQKRKLYETVMGDQTPAQALTATKPATVVPDTVALHELPPGIGDEMPEVRDYKMVKLSDRVLLVYAPNRVIVGEIVRP